MTYPTVFANLAGGTQPASLLDTMFNIGGNQGNIGCTVAGINTITLTPNTNYFLPAAYANFQMVSFVPVSNSTGAVTIQIGALPLVNLYNTNGVQSSSGDIVAGTVYVACFNSQLNSGAGGFQIISAAAAASIPSPGGYLTLTSATPVITADTTVSAPGNMFYTPWQSAQVPIWNGQSFVPTTFSELQLGLNAAHLANTIYDVFIWNNAGTLQLVTGPAWSNSGAGTGARGSGAGTSQLTRVQGFWSNAVSLTARNGVNVVTVGAGFGTYLGSIFMDSVNGQLTCNVAYGQARKFGIWNAYQRRPITIKEGDPNASWAYAGVLRASRGDSTNRITVFFGLAEETTETTFVQSVQSNGGSAATSTAGAQVAIGLNSVVAATGFSQASQVSVSIGAGNIAAAILNNNVALYISPPFLGINNFQSLEALNAGTGCTFFGTEASMVLAARYRG